MFTVNELVTKIKILKEKHKEELSPLEAMFEEVYNYSIANCETLDEQWEIYKASPRHLMEHDFWIDRKDYQIEYEYTFYDVLDQEIKEVIKFDLINIIQASDDDYPHGYTITKDDIVDFFDEVWYQEKVEVYSRKLKKDIEVDIPVEVIQQWKRKFINERIISIRVETYW